MPYALELAAALKGCALEDQDDGSHRPEVLLPAFAASNYVPGIGPTIVNAGGLFCSLDGLDD